MKRFFAWVMCAASLGAAAQMPNSNSEIPVGLQEDVVCWFPLENHFEDISSNAIATSASESGLAFEAETSASFPFQNYLSFSGGVIALGSPSELMWPNLIEGAFSVWLKPQNTNGDGRLFSSENPECCNSIEFRSGQSTASFAGVQFSLIGAYNIVQLPYDDWSHVLVNAETYGQDSIQVSIHLNGGLLLSLDPKPIDTNLPVYGYDDMFIGQKASPGFDKWLGDAAHMVWFSRGLDESEINYLYSGNNSVGCTDPDACNYNVAATESDDTCDYSCCPGPGCCLDGTVWDFDLGGCVMEQLPFLETGGAYASVNPCYFDSNDDGLVEVNDLMNLLSVYNLTCGELPEAAPWQCGDPLEYQGYDYSTVQIGEQCWFAENTRYLPEVSLVETGSETDGSPHAYVYGYSGNSLEEALATESYENFGGLYNFEAVQEWALCPTGWHVPTDDEFKTMESHVGLPQQELDGTVWRGAELAVGNTLRSEGLWFLESGLAAGEVGFEGRPSGYRISWLGDEYFEAAGQYGAWWTSSMSGGKGWQRGIANYNLGIYRTLEFKQVGFAVRCIKD